MLNKVVVLVVATLIGFAVGVTGFAQVDTEEGVLPAEKKAAAPGKRIKTTEPVKRFMGEVISIDMEEKTVSAKGRRGDMVFDLSRARIARNLKLEELKPGDRIAVVYIEKDGNKVAKVVGKPMSRPKRSKAADETRVPEKSAPPGETKP